MGTGQQLDTHWESLSVSIPETPRRPADQAAEFAWRVHNSQESWTGKVDIKASIILAFEGALLVVTAFTGLNSSRPGPASWSRTVGLIGVFLLVVAIVLVCAAILPATGASRALLRDRATNLIYFGHLRYSRPDELVAALSAMSAEDELWMLSQQLVAMSRLNWWKHRLLQASIVLTALALLALIVGVGRQALS